MTSETHVYVPPVFRAWPEDAEIKTFKGRCHCGKITFEFDHPALELDSFGPVACNCSLCTRVGGLYVYGPESAVRIFGNEPAGFLSKNKVVCHRFCADCGNMLFWTGMGRAGANARMFEGVEIDKYQVEKFDGASLV